MELMRSCGLEMKSIRTLNCIDKEDIFVCTSFHNAHLVKEQSTNDYLLLNCCLGLPLINPNEIITTHRADAVEVNLFCSKVGQKIKSVVKNNVS